MAEKENVFVRNNDILVYNKTHFARPGEWSPAIPVKTLKMERHLNEGTPGPD